MKQTLRFLFIVFCLVFQAQLFANTVIVKGTVKDSANHVIANKSVKIYSTDSTQGCALSHTVTTNANGFYTDTLSCNGIINKLLIIVENCNGERITHDVTVGPNTLVENNFVICAGITTPPVTTCKAAFSFVSQATGVKFNAAGSSVPAGDSILSRTWNFGDSTAVLPGTGDPLHVYSKAGIYNVCLTIKTKKGCESTSCQTVVFTPASNDCKIEAVVGYEKLAPKKFRFNNSQATVLAGDSIFQRIWKFSDGSSLDGNQVNPLKEFKDTGVYNVCVTIKTMKGCEKQFCLTITVRDSLPGTVPPPTNCKAQFSTSLQGLTAKFNSANAYAGAGDSIISRTWIFGDSSAQLTGNRIDPSHTYAKAGSFTACLYIKTKNGCESKYCFDFTVRDTAQTTPTNCKAFFTYSIKDSTITFNSADSKGTSPDDSIISRTWYYADSVINVSLGGNIIAPSYTYPRPGSYHIYLVIKTKKGCESKYSVLVVIPPPPPPVPTTGCKAIFSFTMQNGTVKFNSAASKGTTDKDSIISRTWIFGDSTAPVQGNIDPSHVYTKAGKYTVVFYIKTKNGCESKYSETINIVLAPPANCNIDVQFTAERIAVKKVQFNSSLSKAQAGDSIIQRNWRFGDNTVLSGNEIKPVKEFPVAGIYNVCLEEKTAKGCAASFCKQVVVQDTVTTPQSSVDYIKIISINPNPVVTRMVTTIFSRNSNVEAEIAIYDIYGTRIMTVKKLLSQGNNIIEVNTSNLYHGPYFLRVTSKSGGDSKAFYKL